VSGRGLLSLVAALVLAGWARGADAGSAGRDALLAEHGRLEAQLSEGPFGVSVHVSASLGESRVGGDVHAVVEHAFVRVSRELRKAEAWCEILTLHFNVKACRASEQLASGGGAELEIATARKYYVPPSGRNALSYRLDLSRSREDLLSASLQSGKGPLGIRDMSIEVEAIAAPGGGTFLHLHYAYTEAWAARLATRAYLATLGRRKVGFSVVGESSDGEPIYVRGAAGAVERNALRYHLAIVAYFDTLPVHSEGRFEARIARWYDLTDRHRDQLFEMSRERYVEMKRREQADMWDQSAATRNRRRR